MTLSDALELDLNILQGLADRLKKEATHKEKQAQKAQEKARLLQGSIEAVNHYLTIAATLRDVANIILDETESRTPE